MGSYSIAGTLLFGTPELPLTRDLVFGMCYYPEDKITENFNLGTRGSGASLILGPEGEMTIHSANPETARVIFAPHPKTFPYSQYTLPREQWDLFREDQTKLWDTPGFPQGIVMILKGKTNLNGVVFDGLYREGIRVKAAERKQWRNVSFGNNNLAQPAELVKDL
jgi:hypothetical protein